MRILFGAVIGATAIVLGALGYIYSGLFNVAATQPHGPVLDWALRTAMQRSVEARARDIEPPEPLDDAQTQEGFRHFAHSCIVCHGAPGVPPDAIGIGLRPDPPELSQRIGAWSRGELFWIVKHGIKMTGMPGFGPTHADQEIWAIVAFLERLPDLFHEEYQALEQEAEDGSAEH